MRPTLGPGRFGTGRTVRGAGWVYEHRGGRSGRAGEPARRRDAGGGVPGAARRATASPAMKRARTCYDHLAGELGVAVRDSRPGPGPEGTGAEPLRGGAG